MNKETEYQTPITMAVDIGGSKYVVGFVDNTGNVLYQERREWKALDEDAIVEQLKVALHDIYKSQPKLAKQTKVGGVTIPGFADPVSGVWVESDFLPVKNLPLCKILSNEFKIPFFAENDCNACALAERYFGEAKSQDKFLYLTVSTGIGGALFLNNELYYGGFWHAGEIGLFVVEEYGRASDNGSVNGVVEMYASGRGFARNFMKAIDPDKTYERVPGGSEISLLAKQGNKYALQTLELEGRYLGRVIANACTIIDFKKVILGGGISLLFDQYKDTLSAEFNRILPKKEIEIEATKLGYLGAFLGAAAVAQRGLQGFVESQGAGKPEEVVFHVTVSDHIEALLELGNRNINREAADFGKFLAAKTIEDYGLTLEKLITSQNIYELENRSKKGDEEADRVLTFLGNQIGKGIACACILLDPGKVVLEGACTSCQAFQDSILETVKRETYYRGNLPFTILYL